MVQALIGYAILAVMMMMILKKKAKAAFCFAILPVIGAFLCGFNPAQVLDFINKGEAKMWKTAILFIFSVCYFSTMNDAGLFDPLVKKLVKVAGHNVKMVMVATSLIAIVGHMDGASASTYLITIPVMLPIFKRMHLNPLMLLLLVGLSTGIMNLVPWGGPTIRAATAIGYDATQLWVEMIPMQIFGLVVSIVGAVLCGKAEERRLAKEGIVLADTEIETAGQADMDTSLARPKLFFVNLLMTLVVIGMLVFTKVTPFIIFMFGTLIALMVNYPDQSLETKLLGKYAPSCIGLTVTLLCAGVFLGVFANAGIITKMAQVLINLLPGFMVKYLHIIMGVLGAPIGMIMGPDPYYYAVMPLIIETVAPYGVTATEVAHAMLIGENVALSVSPCVATTFLGVGLAGVELNDHIKFTFKWEWLVSIIMLVFAVITGLV